MLIRTGPFREVDRLTQQFFGATTPPPSRVVPMDACRCGNDYLVQFNAVGVTGHDRPRRGAKDAHRPWPPRRSRSIPR